MVSFDLEQIHQFSTIRVNLPSNLKPQSGRITALKNLREVIKRLLQTQGKIPLLDPVKDMKVRSPDYPFKKAESRSRMKK